MAAPAKTRRIDELMEQAQAALVRTRYFEAEELAFKALMMARTSHDFELMARIIMPLQEARRQRAQQALDAGKVRIIDAPFEDDVKMQPGGYVVQPPLVGADARRLRLAALRQRVPVIVTCREPLTLLRLQPVVAICPGLTIRTTLKPPSPAEKPPIAWLAEANRRLGDDSIESVDPTMPASRRVDALLERLDCLPEHENLHQALEAACRDAEQEAEAERNRPRARQGSSKANSSIEPDDDASAPDADDSDN